MRRFLIRLAIALVAFIVGVTAATIFGGLFGLRAQRRCVGGGLGPGTYVVAPAPLPAEHRSCPVRRFDIPEPPAPPAAPEPPKLEKRTRIRVRSADGTVKEVVIKTEKDAEQ
jgi:hypothetical protein